MKSEQERTCQFCLAKLSGRKDKKFCSDMHRNRFNSLEWLTKLRVAEQLKYKNKRTLYEKTKKIWVG